MMCESRRRHSGFRHEIQVESRAKLAMPGLSFSFVTYEMEIVMAPT